MLSEYINICTLFCIDVVAVVIYQVLESCWYTDISYSALISHVFYICLQACVKSDGLTKEEEKCLSILGKQVREYNSSFYSVCVCVCVCVCMCVCVLFSCAMLFVRLCVTVL